MHIKDSLFIVLFTGIAALSWQTAFLITRGFFIDLLPQVILSQSIAVFFSFLLSLGFGTLVRLQVYDSKIMGYFRCVQASYLIGLLTAIIGMVALLASPDNYKHYFSLMIVIPVLMYLQVLLSLAVAKRELKGIVLYSVSIYAYIVLTIALSAYLTSYFEKYFFDVLVLVSSVGLIVFLFPSNFMDRKILKAKELWKESISLFAMGVPIRTMIFAIALAIANISENDLYFASDYVIVAFAIALISFSLSRITLVFEKVFAQEKSGKLVAIFFLSIFLLILISIIILSILFDIHDSIWTVYCFTAIAPFLYSFLMQFEKKEKRNSESGLFMVVGLSALAFVIYSGVGLTQKNLVWLLEFVLLSYFLIPFKSYIYNK